MLKMADEKISFVLPCDNRTKVTLVLFTNIINCGDLKKEVRKGTINACLLRNALILDEFQVLVATNMAVNARNWKCTKTRNIFTEIMYFMSCSKNISESLNKFSVQDSDKSLLAVILEDDDDSSFNQLVAQIRGQPKSPRLNLSQLCDETAVKMVYKIKSEECKSELLNSVVSRMSTKEVMSF